MAHHEDDVNNEIRQLMHDVVDQVEQNEDHQKQQLLELPPQPIAPEMVHTVADWSVRWPDWNSAGQGHKIPWSDQPDNMELQHYSALLEAKGYDIGEAMHYVPNEHDHHIFKVQTNDNIDKRIPRGQYVCKIVSMGFYKNVRQYMEIPIHSALSDFRKETDILLRMRHDNIVEVVDSIELRDRQTEFPFNYGALIMETCAGTLNDLRLISPNERLNEETSRLWVRDIASALQYMHNKEKHVEYRYSDGRVIRRIEHFTVVHMALMMRNILYKEVRNAVTNEFVRFQFKLADFEECYIYEHNGPDEPDIPIVLPEWALQTPYRHYKSASELFWPKRNMPTRPMDMFSLGACIDAMFTAIDMEDYFIDTDFEERVIQFYQNCPLMAQFIRQLTDPVANNRLTADQALQHPWLNP